MPTQTLELTEILMEAFSELYDKVEAQVGMPAWKVAMILEDGRTAFLLADFFVIAAVVPDDTEEHDPESTFAEFRRCNPFYQTDPTIKPRPVRLTMSNQKILVSSDTYTEIQDSMESVLGVSALEFEEKEGLRIFDNNYLDVTPHEEEF